MNKKNPYSPKDIEIFCPECGTPIEKGSYICANCKFKISLAKKSIKAKKIVKVKKAVEPKPEKKEESAEILDKAKDKEIVEEEVEAEEYFKSTEDTDKNN